MPPELLAMLVDVVIVSLAMGGVIGAIIVLGGER